MSRARNTSVHYSWRAGGLLVEVIVALALGILFAVAVVKMGLGTFESVRQSRDQLVAMHYASEGMEAIRAIARKNFSALREGVHGVSFTTTYVLNGNGNASGKFWRTLTLRPLYRNAGGSPVLNPADVDALLAAGGWADIQGFVVDSDVTWTDGARVRSVHMQSVVTKWFTYPLQEVTAGTGGTFNGTQWLDSAVRLGHQPTFNPPVEIGAVSGPSGETIVKLLADAGSDRLYLFTAQGTVRLYSLDAAMEGVLVQLASASVPATVSDAVLLGGYLYVTSSSDSAEVTVLRAENLAIVRVWDLAGTANALSTAASASGQWLLVGRADGGTGAGSGTLLLLTPDPGVASPVQWQKDTNYNVISIAAYTPEWIMIASNRTNEELGIFRVSNTSVTSCNTQGAQLISEIGIVGDSLFMARRSGVDNTLLMFSINPAAPAACANYSVPVWSNGINSSNSTDIFVDLFESRIYALTDELNLHFHYNDTSPSTVTKYTVKANTVCNEIAGDQSLLYVACSGAGGDSLHILGGGGTERSGYVSSGTYISAALNGGPQADWRALYWSGSGGTLRMKIRTASGETMLPSAAWVGPGGSTGAYFTVSGTAIDPLPTAGGTQWLQVKAWLGHTGATLPALQSLLLLLK